MNFDVFSHMQLPAYVYPVSVPLLLVGLLCVTLLYRFVPVGEGPRGDLGQRLVVGLGASMLNFAVLYATLNMQQVMTMQLH